jgi:hypothetical protein
VLLRAYRDDRCCLCGGSGSLTGEHKIKRSALRDEFGNVPLYIGRPGDPDNPLRLAQSPKSKLFHFSGRICDVCNGTRTQTADRAFNEYHKLAYTTLKQRDISHWKDGIFEPPEFSYGDKKSTKLFRYFSKILCCRLAESQGPIPISLAKHAIGEFDQNRVWLQVRRDPIQERFAQQFGEWPYAAHGGLVVYANRRGRQPTGFHSSISIGVVQYVFWFRLHWAEQIELRLAHEKFCRLCRDAALDNQRLLRSDEELESLGF